MSDLATTPLGELLACRPEYGANATALPPDGVRPRYLRITDINDVGTLLSSDIRSIGTDDAQPYLLEPDDIVIARTGNTVGKSYLHLERNGPLAFAGYLVRFRVDPKKAEPTFVFHFLHSPSYFAWVRRTLRTGAQPNINAAEYGRLPVPRFAPPIERRIAEVLSATGETIEQSRALIAKYRQIKAGLMYDLLTRGVTPDGHLRASRSEAPHLYRESLLGWIPKEWDVQRLGTILRQSGGYLQTGPFGSQLHAHEYRHAGIPVVMPQDINHGVVNTSQIARISEKRAQDLSRHRMKAGDVVIARRGALSRAADISQREESWLCGTGCFLLRLQGSTLSPNFAALAYRQDFVQRQVAGMAVGTTMPSLNNKVMEALLFPFCDPDEQARISVRVAGVDSAERLLRSHLRILTSIQRGLMQDLLTGYVRVNSVEGATA